MSDTALAGCTSVYGANRPGTWQINVQIPKTVVTTSGVWFDVIVNGQEANWDATSPFKTYIYVK